MTPVRANSSGQGTPLLAGWELAFTAAGAAAGPAALAALSPAWLAAPVPGTAASALQALGRWSFDQETDFDAGDVWYRCTLPKASAAGGRRALRFDGLATLCDAWLDGAHLLRSENMFLAHAVPLPEGGGPGVLLLRFASLKKALAQKRPRPRWKTRLVDQQQLRWFRTTLLGRIPGWSPPVAAVGPWRGVFLEERGPVEVVAASLRSSWDGAGAVEALLQVRAQGPAITAAWLEAGGSRAPLRLEAGEGGLCVLAGNVRVAEAEAWWPHTHGTQPLAAVRVVLEREGAGPVVLDCGRTGFRQITVDRAGGAFTLRVNGEEIFCRGACWTPLDVVTLSATPAALRTALEQVRDAGMNMLRVGGTMVYQDQAFHDLCDELGILVFQDFQLANLDYPAQDPAWAASMRAEAGQFLSRTQLSPSLAVLCGGSEVEQQAAMLGLPEPAREQALAPLFDQLLPERCAAARPDVPYARNSPTGGALPFQVDAGLSHYYGVGAYLRPLEDARRAGVRFTSECLAFANVPAQETVDALLGDGQRAPHHPRWKRRVPRDGGAGWDFDDVRDHYLKVYYNIDPLPLRYADHERYLELSRAVTGEVMAQVLGEWRLPGSTCKGALLWFLRDLWPGAGWGVVDSFGRPKAAFWYLRRALRPVALHLADEGLNGLRLHVHNDRPAPLEAKVRLALYQDGESKGASGERAVTVGPRSTASLEAVGLFEGFLDLAWAYRFGPPSHTVAVASLTDAGTGALLSQALHFPLGRDLRQEELGLQARLAEEGGALWLVLQSRRLAQGVHCALDGFAPDDDWFTLEPGVARRVRLRPTTAPAGATPRGEVSALNGRTPARF